MDESPLFTDRSMSSFGIRHVRQRFPRFQFSWLERSGADEFSRIHPLLSNTLPSEGDPVPRISGQSVIIHPAGDATISTRVAFLALDIENGTLAWTGIIPAWQVGKGLSGEMERGRYP
jgi:hypothetical protein